MKSRLLGALSACVFMLMSTATSAALVDNGNGLIYDDVLKITWAQPDNARNWDAANTPPGHLDLRWAVSAAGGFRTSVLRRGRVRLPAPP